MLSIWADAKWGATGSKAVDASLNGDTGAACAQLAYDLEGKDTTGGVPYAAECGGVLGD